MGEAISDETAAKAIADGLSGFGGILRCETCGRWQEVAGADGRVDERYTRDGWPKCHGYTMRWWTQRQLDAGEMPVLNLETP